MARPAADKFPGSVPASALARGADTSVPWFKPSSAVHPAAVAAIIRTGLSPEDKVVVGGFANPMVRPGAAVTPQPGEIKPNGSN